MPKERFRILQLDPVAMVVRLKLFKRRRIVGLHHDGDAVLFIAEQRLVVEDLAMRNGTRHPAFWMFFDPAVDMTIIAEGRSSFQQRAQAQVGLERAPEPGTGVLESLIGYPFAKASAPCAGTYPLTKSDRNSAMVFSWLLVRLPFL